LFQTVLGWSATDRIALFAADPTIGRKRYWLAEAACREAESRIGSLRLIVAHRTPPDLVPIYMSAADCLLLTSVHEGSPNVVKEAVTCGLPVVSTDVGDVREVLDGVDPSWVCPADPGQLGAALAECMTEQRRSNGWARSAWIGQDQIGLRLLDLYRRQIPELADASADNRRGIELRFVPRAEQTSEVIGETNGERDARQRGIGLT
jgi:teichuronic acid biosynthesis glycosyltransferase TuaC